MPKLVRKNRIVVRDSTLVEEAMDYLLYLIDKQADPESIRAAADAVKEQMRFDFKTCRRPAHWANQYNYGEV